MTGFSGGMSANLGVSAGLAVGGRVRQVYEDLIPTGAGKRVLLVSKVCQVGTWPFVERRSQDLGNRIESIIGVAEKNTCKDTLECVLQFRPAIHF